MTGATGAAITPVVVDASVWVSFFLSSDIHHNSCFNWIDARTAAGGLIIGPGLLLSEVAGAISRRMTNPQIALLAAGTILRAPWMQLVELDQALAWSAADLASRLGLRGADAVYVALAEQLHLPLLTVDQEQLTRPAGVIRTMRP